MSALGEIAALYAITNRRLGSRYSRGPHRQPLSCGNHDASKPDSYLCSRAVSAAGGGFALTLMPTNFQQTAEESSRAKALLRRSRPP